MSQKTTLYVDLDNIYIVNKKPNITLLKKRVMKIKTLNIPVKYFGNTYTWNIVKQNKIRLNMTISDIAKNSADHSMLNSILRDNTNNVFILTYDVTLGRLASYLVKNKNVKLAQFDDADDEIYVHDIDFQFKRRKDLSKFLDSLELYKLRYNSTSTLSQL